MKERFIEFLEKNNCLKQFKQNIRNNEDFDVYCNRTWASNSRWVTTAFDWESSPQRHKYWDNFHIQWFPLAEEYQRQDEIERVNAI